MKFEIKKTKEKISSSYKTIYLADSIIEQITDIAKEHDTSFNNVVVSMIEACLDDRERDSTSK